MNEGKNVGARFLFSIYQERVCIFTCLDGKCGGNYWRIVDKREKRGRKHKLIIKKRGICILSFVVIRLCLDL